jgi:hypothetical protein
MNKLLLQKIREDMNVALAEVAKKYDLESLRATNCTYRESGFDFKIEGILKGGKSKEAERYEQNHHLFGLPPLNEKIRFGNETYEMVGMNTTGSKVHGKRSDGKVYLLDADRVALIWKATLAKTATK